ncbi:hypothetical protein M758_8G003100 [Ceratodon purpureus]|uniref:Uncharacterized protein n=1 Tax=Ceratodon purpureus TaxID=3225 RepID=A0A8T0GXU1_CERPU|nr:hypothetical protein KC19_8G003800 [Ceratodon purpureus]KAG0607095.1 hypothetical protein M758_8G003100 [Ceratodon purpureus]
MPCLNSWKKKVLTSIVEGAEHLRWRKETDKGQLPTDETWIIQLKLKLEGIKRLQYVRRSGLAARYDKSHGQDCVCSKVNSEFNDIKCEQIE